MDFTRLSRQRVARQLLHMRSGFQCLNKQHFSPRTQVLQSLRNNQFKALANQSRSIHTPRRTPVFSFSSIDLAKQTRIARVIRIFRRGYSEAAAVKEESLSLSQRLKKLSREYGWAAVGVYFALSAADFPFCFMAVRIIGVNTIGHWEHVILEYIKSSVSWFTGSEGTEEQAVDAAAVKVEATLPLGNEKRILEEASQEQWSEYSKDEIEDHGYHEAVKANEGANASIWTQLALAYAIHKSFIFIRVPLTAAVTPKVVKTLRGWGWNIGKMPTKKVKTGTGVNAQGSGVKPDKS